MAEQVVGFRRLTVWQKADELTRAVYVITKRYPPEELYGLTSQIRRAALSVPLNIVEGYGRQGKKSFAQFIAVAYGSLMEVEYLLELSNKLGYLPNEDTARLSSLAKEVARMLWQLRRRLHRA